MFRLAALAAITLSAPLAAKDSLGVFSDWGAFRDPSVPRCYAIAIASPSSATRELEPFATIGTWPGRNLRGQVHFRLSRQLSANGSITLCQAQVDVPMGWRSTTGGPLPVFTK